MEVPLSEGYRDEARVSRGGIFSEPRRRRRDLVTLVIGCLSLVYFLLYASSISYEADRLFWFAFVSLSVSILLQGAAELLPWRWTASAGILRICSSILSLIFIVLLIWDLIS